MANCNNQQLNITCGTDVVLRDTLIFDGETFDPALSVGITANLVNSLGKRTALEVEVADGGLIIYVPWVDGRNAGCYGLEVTGTCNSKKWATYADSLIHYTRATEIGVAEVTIESDYYDITQEVGFRYSTSPINAVTATVDDQVGTPSVEYQYDGKNINFDFHNLKGQPFTYDDLTPQQKEELRGEQGATGVYDQTTQDFLTTLETTTGQSQTKTMTQKAITDEFEKDRLWGINEINLDAMTLNSYNIYSDTTSSYYGKWSSGGATSNSCWIFPVTSGSEIQITPQSGKRYEIAFLRTINYANNQVADFSGGETPSTLRYTVGGKFTVPQDAAYMYVCKMFSSTNYAPSSIGIVKLTKKHIEELEDTVDNHGERITQLDEELLQSSIHKIEEITLPSTATGDGLNYINPTSSLWAGNTIYWSGLVMEVEPEATYKIVPQAGYLVRYAWLTANGRTAGQQPSFAYGCTVSTGAINETLYITAPSDAHYIYLNRNSESAYKAKQPSFFGKVIYINDAITELEGGASAVDKDTLALVKHAAYKRTGSDNAESLPYLNLLHYSDIHGSQLAAGKILNARNALLPYIHDVVNTGDVINAIIGGSYSGENFYPNSGLQEVSLFTLGNHDDLLDIDTGERKDKAWSHALYFTEEVIEALGITMPTGYDDSTSPNYNACYWHKDYADQKVRIIGLDCRNKYSGIVDPATGLPTDGGSSGNEQEVWLVARMAETLVGSGNTAAGYSVIVAGHYPLDNYDGDNTEWDDNAHKWVCNHKSTGGRIIDQKTGEVTNWHRYTSTLMAAAASMRWSNASGHNNIAEIIKHYMEQAGSNFVAFICGHTHNNLFFYPTNYPDILNICIDMAGGLRNMYYADQDTMGGYIANFLSFATSSKIVRIVRLGVKSDTLLTPINYITYDYYNRKVIQEG